ncbi:MAG: hypothetical protein ACR2FY_06020 [Pirellulaceae bacterium]
MTLLLTCTLLLVQPADVPPEPVQKYLQCCEAAKAATIAAKEAALQSLTGDKLAHARAELAKFKTAHAPLLHLPLPPRKGELGTFATADELPGGKSLVVLEVTDKENAIVRAWYVPTGEMEPTFVDVWIQGIDTSSLTAGSAAKLLQVFHVTGNKLIDTTCGKRSFPLLEPVELERKRAK